jgi:hypothetical protein
MVLNIAVRTGCPGGARLHPGLQSYFFFDFLAFFAFFAFFAFLAIASSFELMEGNATRGMLGGGPASQHPRRQSQQIRRLLPRAVTRVSSRYPQLLWVLRLFWRCDQLAQAIFCARKPNLRTHTGSSRVNDAPTRRHVLYRMGTAARHVFMLLQPRRGLRRAGESPLSDVRPCCPQDYGDSRGWAVR